MTGVIAACRHYQRYPTRDELLLFRQSNKTIPNPETLRGNFGDRAGLIAALVEYVREKPEFADVSEMLPALSPTKKVANAGIRRPDGNVYLIKFGPYYKIGRGEDLEKRVKQVVTALPDKGELLHSIKTDDPSGIEAYWHRRFKDCRANGENFKLTPADVKAFMRRTFQ